MVRQISPNPYARLRSGIEVMSCVVRELKRIASTTFNAVLWSKRNKYINGFVMEGVERKTRRC